MTGGLIALIAALVAALAVGAILRLRAGRVRSSATVPAPAAADQAGDSRPADGDALTAEDLGSPLGVRATLVQFSTEYCAYCGPTREVLGEIAGERDGVEVIEIDASDRMDLTKRLRVFSTPTVLVLGPEGDITARSTGRPRKTELAQAVSGVLGDGVGLSRWWRPGDDRSVAGE